MLTSLPARACFGAALLLGAESSTPAQQAAGFGTPSSATEIIRTIPSRPSRILPVLSLGAWDSRFALPAGVNGEVLCAVTMGNYLYVGGRFTRAGELVTGGIARWDGHQWQAVGDGVDGNVGALFVHGNSLYVGGQFRTLGAVNATNIARWTRHGWQSLGGGIPIAGSGYSDQFVAAILVRGRDVFVGGSFTEAGGVAAMNVAKWDGRQWSALGHGIRLGPFFYPNLARVEALEWCRGSLFVGGRFTQAGEMAVKNLARWNGREWRDVDAGVQGGNTGILINGEPHYGNVLTLTRQGTDLLVGGDFTQAGELAATNLVRWNGRRWSRVGGGVQGGGISAICVRGLEVFVAGAFDRAGNIAANNVARWDGRRWKALDSGVRGYASALALRGKKLYVGGYFGLAGGIPAAFVAQRTRGEWSALDVHPTPMPIPIPFRPQWPFPTNALIGEVRALAAQGTNVYVGGQLFSAGLVPVNGLAHWNGTQWSDMGGGIPNGSVQGIAVEGSNVYVAGTFVLPDVRATNLARWDGTQWSDVRVHLAVLHDIVLLPGQSWPPAPIYDEVFYNYPESVYAVAAGGGKLYVSGTIATVDGRRQIGLTAWNGTNWTLLPPLSVALNTDPVYASSLVAGATDLYAAVGHSMVPSYGNVIRWDGDSWSSLDGAPRAGQSGASPVRAMALQGTNLFVSGDALTFGAEGENARTNLLRWDGLTWSSAGMPTIGESTVLALAATTNVLYAGGAFTNVGGQFMPNVARWNGAYWRPLGAGIGRNSFTANGVREYVSVIAASDGRVYCGGQFGEAGGYSTFNFAVWDENLLDYYWPNLPPRPPLPPIPVRPPIVGTSMVSGAVRRVNQAISSVSGTTNPPLPPGPLTPPDSPAAPQPGFPVR